MIRRLRGNRGESGQFLVLFTLMLVVVVLFAVLTIDVGALYLTRRDSQNTIDSAALAGAQELPDDFTAAEQKAREWAANNGADPAKVQVTFGCTSTLVQLCNPGANIYDTIYVDYEEEAPAFFGPILSIMGDNSCFQTGCTTPVHAAACTGVCGTPNNEVDVMLIIDHTRSMTATDLANAKDGALAFMRTFDDTKQRLGLGVTPPVEPNNNCDTINNWSDPKTWLPVPLTSSYQSSPGVLDNNSKLVSTTNCLDVPLSSELSGSQTNLGDPLAAAMQQLKSNGRNGVPHAIVLETDGAANIMDTAAANAIGAKGPCDYAYKVAQQVKAAGIELYTVAYGADDTCVNDGPGSPWQNKTATELITALATDSDHAFIEPKTGDLEEVFLLIGTKLASGSKLIE